MTFPYMTTMVITLAAISAATYLLRPFIPIAAPSKLAKASGDFVRAGARKRLPWRLLDAESFAEARRKDKPLLIVVSAGWSRMGRRADSAAFGSVDLDERLRQDFICVRVDVDENPEWLSALIPIDRAQIGIEPSFQIFMLDSSGRLINSLMHRSPKDRMDAGAILWFISRARRQSPTSDGHLQSSPGVEQALNVRSLFEAPIGTPDYQARISALESRIDPRYGGLVLNDFQFLEPEAWRFMLKMGEIGMLHRSLDPALASPLVDWLDGGFFRLANTPNWGEIEFDKVAIENASMMSFLVQMWRVSGDNFYRELAVRTFDCLAGPFQNAGLVRAYRAGDEMPNTRSHRSSFSPLALRGPLLQANFSPSERDWLRANFNLRVETNPQMVPTISNRSLLEHQGQLLESYLVRLRELAKSVEPVYGGEALLDVNATVCARMLDASMWLGDQARLNSAAALFEELAVFRAGGDEVIHSVRKDGKSVKYLGDYLSFADAALSYYIAFGRRETLDEGLAVLKRALVLYGTSQEGVLLNCQMEDLQPGPADAEVPNLTDEHGESTIAKAIRLLHAYGSLYPKQGLEQRSLAIMSQFSEVANHLRYRVLGFFASAFDLQEDLYALTIGKNAVALAHEVMQRSPTALVLPIHGGIRADTSRWKPGIYVVHRSKTTGPLDPEAARASLASR